MKPFFISLLLIIIPLQLGFLYLKNPPESPPGIVAGISQATNIENSVSIGEFRFSLFGYTSPLAQVTFEGMGIFDQTVADDKGYFQFNNRFSPFSSREACLSSKDQFGRLSSPLCLPPFPVNYNVSIGPVIMPPTVSLDKKDYFMGDQVILSGQTIPNTEVDLAMFTQNGNRKLGMEAGISFPNPSSIFFFIKPVEAFTFPQLDIKSDSKGNFSINLPSSNPEKFRLFAQTNFKKSISPNSVKLNLEILPVWMIIIKFFLFILSLIRPRLLEIIILGEIIFIVYYLLKRFFHPQTALVLREGFMITRIDTKQNTNGHEG
ncbi:MAG: hypothetical protein Q7U68_02890 [Candidatus Roizmanbacteria bacterium]|nr:hypothetical protein [Candidatus Roizmanbacteria bacterium]